MVNRLEEKETLESKILAKLSSSGLSIDSPEKDIYDCLNRCVGAVALCREAKKMLWEYRQWKKSQDDTPLGVFEGWDWG